ncbi:hypothetical protein SO694_001060115 [Aureococcus anophagefferens]|uniref:Uncharacterized protein n=1 Tax=Aureococcus anophagefferens TaxID=44056 RepID=A0ABR1FMR1_AURAN
MAAPMLRAPVASSPSPTAPLQDPLQSLAFLEELSIDVAHDVGPGEFHERRTVVVSAKSRRKLGKKLTIAWCRVERVFGAATGGVAVGEELDVVCCGEALAKRFAARRPEAGGWHAFGDLVVEAKRSRSGRRVARVRTYLGTVAPAAEAEAAAAAVAPKKFRAAVFAAWLERTLGRDRLETVLDVAGGRGDLAAALLRRARREPRRSSSRRRGRAARRAGTGGDDDDDDDAAVEDAQIDLAPAACGDAGAVALARALAKRPPGSAPVAVDVSGNELSGRGWRRSRRRRPSAGRRCSTPSGRNAAGGDDATLVPRALRKNERLEALGLAHCGLGPGAADLILSAAARKGARLEVLTSRQRAHDREVERRRKKGEHALVGALSKMASKALPPAAGDGGLGLSAPDADVFVAAARALGAGQAPKLRWLGLSDTGLTPTHARSSPPPRRSGGGGAGRRGGRGARTAPAAKQRKEPVIWRADIGRRWASPSRAHQAVRNVSGASASSPQRPLPSAAWIVSDAARALARFRTELRRLVAGVSISISYTSSSGGGGGGGGSGGRDPSWSRPRPRTAVRASRAPV